MVYPKRIVWKEASSAHPQPRGRNPQRDRVEASLRLTDGRVDRWDERTRTVHRVRAA
ncbi:MAG: hypothetical protein QOE65_523 [Solirubrobacteraceae bacterium]|jgi:hypothetical protein|nr:hypothetical protein [Solirubrobacteraceae bacterium]